MGLARAAADCITASRKAAPSATFRLTKSTSRMELRTMMPASAIMPIIEVAVKLAPSSACPGITPITVSGIGAMMTSGTT